MSDDKIKTLYVCPVCLCSYKTQKAAKACLRAHESEIICRRIELGCTLGSSRYDFFISSAFRRSGDYNLNTEVNTYGLYDGYPKFETECLDNDADIFGAKMRLIDAAHKWTEKYNEVLAGLERKLEDGK